MNLIKLIFIILLFQGLSGQAISTPKTIKPVIILENIEENSLVTFIAFEEREGAYKTAKGYHITKSNKLFPRPEIFSMSLDTAGTSFFSGAHYADITGEGTPELILLITNPQTGTQVRSWTLGPGYTTKTPLHEPYYIKTKQKASEVVSSEIDAFYQDKDYELAICFGSPERKAVIIDYRGELNTKVIAKKFLENNVGPIELRTKDLNNDGRSDIYILSNGAIKEEKIYYAPEFKPSESKIINIKEKIRDLYFISNTEGTTLKILLLKNETLYVEKWEKYFPTEELGSYKIIGHNEKDFFVLTKKGDIFTYNIDENNKNIKKTKKTPSSFTTQQFNNIEHLFFGNNQVLLSHNAGTEAELPEISLQTIEKKETKAQANLEEEQPKKEKEEQKKPTGKTKAKKSQTQRESKNKKEEKELNAIRAQKQGEEKGKSKTTKQDTLIITVGEKKEMSVFLESQEKFIGLEKMEGPPGIILDKTKLAFIWTPTMHDIGFNALRYKATYNTADEYEIYFEEGKEKLRPKQELQTTKHALTIYVNAKPTIKISPSEEHIISANQELIIPIYINDPNTDQTLSLSIKPENIENSKIENRKFFWTPKNEDYGPNPITFIVKDGLLEDQANITVFVDTVKTEIKFDQKLITTVNQEFLYDLPSTKTAQVSILEAPENVRISKDRDLHWIPTAPELGENIITVEIKEKDQTYFYNIKVFVNAPPVISYRPNDVEYVKLGETFQFTMKSFEENENQKHYWTSKEKPTTMQLNNAEIYWVADEPDYQRYHIELSDTIDSDNFYGSIYVNDAPRITSAAPDYIELGDTLMYQIIVEDKNKQSAYNDTLRNEPQYFLKTFPTQMSLIKNTLMWIPGKEDVGQHLIEFEVYDGIEKAEQIFNLFVNDVPAIVSDNNIKIAVGEELHHFVKATDSNDLTNLIFGINSTLDNMFMNTKTGEILWTPTEKDLGNNAIEVSVSDGFDLSKDIQKINIFVYKNPQFSEPTLPEAYAGVEYNHKIRAEDMYKKTIPGIDVFVNFKESNFKEISFDTTNYMLQIIPTFGELGTQYVSLSLRDNYNNQITEAFPIKVLSSPCETSDTLYVGQEEVVNKLQKIDKSIVYTSKNEKLNILGNETTSPDTIFITKYDTTITNITDSIFVTINNPEHYKRENTKLTKRQKRKAEQRAARLAKKTKKTANKQNQEQADKEKTTKEPLVITTQHKNINIINKETVVIEQIILPTKPEPEKGKKESVPKAKTKSKKETRLGHEIEGIQTPKEDKLKKHLFGQKSIEKTQKTDYIIPTFLDQPMRWAEE